MLCRLLALWILYNKRNSDVRIKEVSIPPHRFVGLKVSDILKLKKGSIKQAQLPENAPTWDELNNMTWEEIEAAAEVNIPGYRTIRKLLSDKRFDK
ncbi:hypothetical protein NIES4071_44230 [Calothrix sp. NIES-4071]|nr:hypothetical protein NIES4071_44230 [Calothrix sp. NIES-4071]BAZ58737.1 hypothetical protein NIES4105_44160 [Calothrix sp. NIES-4105]